MPALKVLIHPGVLYCTGCGHELQWEHGTVLPTTLQWICECTFSTCPQLGQRVVIPFKSMVCLTAPKV